MSAPKRGGKRRLRIDVLGRVQGVGYRPFVYRLAKREGVSGWVMNTPAGVAMEAEGESETLERFVTALKSEAPPLAVVESVTEREVRPTGEDGFRLRRSSLRGRKEVLLPPDVATCAACFAEVFDPRDRRHLYPFTNCTDCGPRYTIAEDLPYDRSRTTMRGFSMCENCRREYDDPANRRFHAQPNACPVCGPKVWLVDARGRKVRCGDPIRRMQELLKAGEVVAIKGLGGFHLAVNAADEKAVARLRERKRRPFKPLALMVEDMATVERLCRPSAAEREALLSWRAPIVLVPKRSGAPVVDAVAPNVAEFGVMLPYTPLHHVLMRHRFGALVMTSGNRQDEPTIHEDDVALSDLAGVADHFLLHDRPITVQNDDSVMRLFGDSQVLIRRARGWVPEPVSLPVKGKSLLALGAEEKNTVCVTRGRDAFCSQHLGDMRNLRTFEAFERVIDHLRRLLQVSPTLVVHDMHPGYFTSKHAVRMGMKTVAVQHHHAHVLACLAEHGLNRPVIGVCYDGVGYGADGTVWGAEFLLVDGVRYRREAKWSEILLAGGEAAIKQPWRTALALLYGVFGGRLRDADVPLFGVVSDSRITAVESMLRTGTACVSATSMGRLFDGAAALAGVCYENTYEGQAPCEFEALLSDLFDEPPPASERLPHYHYGIDRRDGVFTVDVQNMMIGLVGDTASGRPRSEISLAFHETVARATAEVCHFLRERLGIETVVLTGGSFQNRFLTMRVRSFLEADGMTVLTHSLVPPNDAGISLGQAYYGLLLSSGRRRGRVSRSSRKSRRR